MNEEQLQKSIFAAAFFLGKTVLKRLEVERKRKHL